MDLRGRSPVGQSSSISGLDENPPKKKDSNHESEYVGKNHSNQNSSGGKSDWNLNSDFFH